MLGSIFKNYWRLTLFKEGPEDTPHSLFLLVMLAVLFFLLMIWQWFMADVNQELGLSVAIMAGFSLLFSYFIYTFVLLKWHQKTYRIVQTLSSLFAAHLIIHFLAFPLLWIAPLLTHPEAPVFALFVGILYLLFAIILTAWQFLVTANIYRHALDLTNLASMMASFGLLACNILIVSFW